MLADGVQVLSGRHQHGSEAGDGTLQENEQTFERVTIGKGAWIVVVNMIAPECPSPELLDAVLTALGASP